MRLEVSHRPANEKKYTNPTFVMWTVYYAIASLYALSTVWAIMGSKLMRINAPREVIPNTVPFGIYQRALAISWWFNARSFAFTVRAIWWHYPLPLRNANNTLYYSPHPCVRTPNIQRCITRHVMYCCELNSALHNAIMTIVYSRCRHKISQPA